MTGFSTGELDVILNGTADPEDEVIPEVPASPRTRLGDIWILGQHRVGCGDARDLDFVRRLVGEQAAIDTAFLEPPYNVRISGHANAVGRHREFAMASGERARSREGDPNPGQGLAARLVYAVRLIDNSPLGFVRGHEHHLSYAAVSLASSKPRSASGPTLAPMRTLINDQPTCSAGCIATIGTGHMVA